MNNVAEIVQTVFIGLLVARFLLNTCRVLKAIELCKECLVTLNNKAFEDKDTLTKTIYKDVYQTMSRAYFLINNYTGAIKYARKFLAIHHALGERFEESRLSIEIGTWFYRQNKFEEAKELSQRALLLTLENNDKKREALCYVNLGSVLHCLGEYDEAREHLEKAFSVMKAFGERNEKPCVTLT